MFSDYYQLRQWLEGFIPQTYTKKELGLGRIRHLLKLLGNPQEKFKSIHIAGTSGKGSTAYYTARLLAENFKFRKIGLHLSPHLVYIGERMQINNKPIKVIELIKLINQIKPVVESMKTSEVGLPSYFEILVAVSFLYFVQEKVDIAIVEVGLGGRLDATNVLRPEVSVITNVGFDHTDILGKTTKQIAYEKAGIIKLGIPVVTWVNGKALEIIKKVVKEKKANLITKSTLIRAFGKKSDINKYRKLYKRLFDNSFPFVTEETFLLSCAVVASLGISLTEAEISEAFNCPFAGRFEEIEKGVILDGAHNLDKIKVLVRWIKNQKPETRNQKLILVLAFKKGKDWRGMVDYLFRNLDIERCITTCFYSVTDMGFYASVEPDEIARYVKSKWKVPPEGRAGAVASFDNSHEAVFGALSSTRGVKSKQTPRVRSAGLVLITGSLYLVGEVRTLWELPEF